MKREKKSLIKIELKTFGITKNTPKTFLAFLEIVLRGKKGTNVFVDYAISYLIPSYIGLDTKPS